MRRFKFSILIVLFSIFILSVDYKEIFASSATTYTYTLDEDHRIIRTQDAYLPDQTILKLELDTPQDLFVVGDYLYIVDQGNNRIVKYNYKLDVIEQEITSTSFRAPQGIYITDDYMYIADSGAKAVFKMDLDGNIIDRYDKPESPAFGTKDFTPRKVAVDKGGNIFVIGEGVYDGIIQLSDAGEFIGFFASNDVVLTFKQMIENIIFTEEQIKNSTDRDPPTFSNVFVGDDGLVYSTTMSSRDRQEIKKHTTSGENMFDSVIAPDDISDIYVDDKGLIYAVSISGTILVYSNEGEYIHSFGALSAGDDISGIYESLIAIAVDDDGRIWTIDSTKSFIQSFKPTDYANKIYEAIDLFNNSQYEAAAAIWEDVLILNQMSVLAHNNIGKNYLYQEKYEEALVHFEIAGNRDLYSEAYWEIRNIWLRENLSLIFYSLIALFILRRLNKFLNKKYKYLDKIKGKLKIIFSKKLLLDLGFFFKFIKHPLDSFYKLKNKERGSTLSASIIVIVMFVVYIIFITSKGFIYQYVDVEDIDFNAITIGFFGLIFLFVICNYLVSSIQEGEANINDLFKMLAYSFAPLMLSMIINLILSYYLTYNEVFVLEFINIIGLLWSGMLVLLGLQEMHTYDFRDVIKSMIFTIAFMLVIIVVILIIIIMWDQVINFFVGIFKEVWRNVTN